MVSLTKRKPMARLHEDRFPEFFAEIVAAPDDDAPRLVFADDLEELGDPRGEFIRAQCDMAHLPSYHARHYDLSARTDELLAEFGKDWTPSTQRYISHKFQRGFPELLDARMWRSPMNSSLHTISKNVQLLRTMIFSSVPNAARSTLTNSNQFEGLRELHISQNEDLSFLRSPKWKKLESLVVTGGFREQSEPEHLLPFSAYSSLRKLSIAGSSLKYRDLVKLLKDMSTDYLSHISLPNGALRTSGLRHILEMSWCGEIVALDLPFNAEIGAQSFDTINPPSPLKNLRELDLASCPLKKEYSFFANHCGGLEKLHVTIPAVDVDFLRTIVDAGIQLQSLSVTHSNIGSAAISLLTEHPSFSQLTELDLSHNMLQSKDIIEITKSSNLKNLRDLKLVGNKLTDPAAVAIADSKNFAKLRKLDLSHNGIRERGLRELANSTELDTLKEFLVYYNHGDESSGRALREKFGRVVWV
jgi:uncharacterized protein (TIGR02996 family)